MNALIIGLYGVYLLMVGFKGNSKQLLSAAQSDAPGFLPWAVSIAVLAILYNGKYTKDITSPFIGLLILAFILKNFDVLKKEFQDLYAMVPSTSSASQTGS